MRGQNTTDILVAARMVANFASAEGIDITPHNVRLSYNHLGAILADAVLQAGLNYKSVVQPRVTRILSEFENVNCSSSLMGIVETGRVPEFLNWNHPVKVLRFERLVKEIYSSGIKDSEHLRSFLEDDSFCISLQKINGIGPKTVDYMSCLVGIDSVAVDRHIRSYARRAGVDAEDYHFLKYVFCFSADLLSMSRREFDSWVWQRESSRTSPQLSLNFC